MNKKMSFFRFCRQGLTALPVFLVFISCDKLLPTSGSGELVPVKIRSVSVRDYSEVSATRAAGGEKRIVGQPIVQDLGDGMLAEITVEEEDVSALRATQLGSDSPVKFRVIAVNSSDNKVYSYADYTAGSGAISRDGSMPDLHVVSGGSYYFVCISYNNSTLPPAPNEGDDLSNVTIAVTAGSNDLLYQTFTPTGTIPTSGEVNLEFKNLTHKLARVTMELNGNGKTITAVDGSKISLDAATSGNFNLKEDEFSDLSGNTVFTGWTGYNSTEVTSGMSTFIPKASEDYTLSFAVGAVTRGGAMSTSAWTAIILNSKFVAGGIYTIVAKLYNNTSAKFAGSNIYWDGQKLTFDDHGTTTHQYYQGVFFKWGSLIGISPAQTTISGKASESFSAGTVAGGVPGNTIDGTPIYLKNPDGNWVKTNVAYATAADQKWFDWWRAVPDNTTDSAAWNAIPSYRGTDITDPNLCGMDKHTLLAKSDFEHYLGDICNYLKPGYRMPTGNELAAIVPDPFNSYSSASTAAEVNEANQAGRYELPSDRCATLEGGRIFPTTRSRYYTSGNLDGLGGSSGCYWSSSAISGKDYVHTLKFNNLGTTTSVADISTSRRYGQAVRCVKIE